MNDNPLEKVIESKVCEYARSKGMLAYKFTSPQRAAVPDRMLICNGKAFFIEFKRRGLKPTPAQEREHATLRAHGMRVFVVDSVEQGKGIIDALEWML